MASPVRATIAGTNYPSRATLPIELEVSHNPLNSLKTQVIQPPLSWRNWHRYINWFHFLFIATTHLIAIGGWMVVSLQWKTVLFSALYGYFLSFGINAGYHRLWAHRSYNASLPLQYFLAILGAAALQRDILWWCRLHRVHHRFTDTDLDPYNAARGFWFSHIGWLLFYPRYQLGRVDVSDLRRNSVVMWQRRYYYVIVPIVSIVIPSLIPQYCWGESIHGSIIGTSLRMVGSHHGVSSVNSVAHWFGDATFDDKLTPRDHWLTGLLTLGEGYHNFHHQYPMDYRNGVKWYHFDQTKWFIWCCKQLGLASNLKAFSQNEIQKSQLTMQLKALRKKQDKIVWPTNTSDLPVINWKGFQEQSLRRPLIVIAGFIHDISDFIDEHPGGADLLIKQVGQDATAAFFGGIYDHSNAAHNLLAMKRVGVLHGGVQPGLDEEVTAPSQRLRIVRYNEINGSPY